MAIGVNDPKRIKKLKPNSGGSTSVNNSGIHQNLLALAASMGATTPNSTASFDYARATGRRIVYATPQGYVTELGEPTERSRDDVVLQVNNGLPN